MQTGRPLSAVIEEGIRQVLAAAPPFMDCRTRDLSWSNPNGPDRMSQYSWEELRELIYNDR